MSDMADIYRDRLNDYCVQKGWISAKNPRRGSPSELAKRLWGTSSQWSDLLAGRKSFSADLARRIEERLELPRLYLEGGQVEHLDVPHISVSLSAGHGSVPHVEETIGALKFRKTFLQSVGVSANNACVLDVSGRSMEPTIPDGSVVLISRSNREARDRMIFAVLHDSELFVKRLIRLGDKWIARSDNEDRSAYPDFELNGSSKIIGRAVWMGVRL